ncbi:hypothetical protein [Dokdonella sp.]|uniref:hypothetical protein n=1 Tax=Dokdonella sp. TaxID=2291710 RepID=UPI00378477EC
MRAHGWWIVILLTCMGPLAASGREPAPLGPALDSIRHFSGPTLTGAALRRCVVLDAEARDLARTLKQETQNLDVAEQIFKRLGEDLDRDEVTLDHTDGGAIDRYNERVNRHAALVEDYNARLPAHTVLVEKHNAVIDEFNRQCSGRAYVKQEWIDASAKSAQ